jgi:phosphoribosylformylglycinamidine synthase
MALAGKAGISIDPDWFGPASLAAQMFGEDQGRYLVAIEGFRSLDELPPPPNGLVFSYVGLIGTDPDDDHTLSVGDGPGAYRYCEVPLAELRAAHESFFREWMEA